MDRSSRPPNAPPTPASVSRTLSGGRPSAGADLPLVDVQPLGGDVQVDAAVLGRHGQPGLRAEEGLVLHADLVLAGHHDVGHRVRVALAELQVPDQVAVRVQLRPARDAAAGRVARSGVAQRLARR